MSSISNIQAFLNLIGKSEGAEYDIMFGGKRFTDFTKHPNICVPFRQTCSTAAGKYQINKPTYNDIAPKIGVTDFTPHSQDNIAVELIKRANAYNDVLNGNIESAINKCSGRWASFPKNNYNQPKHSMATLLGWYNEFKIYTVEEVQTKKKRYVLLVLLLIVVLFVIIQKYLK
jgi:muramidase (phage lysozyme)